MLQCFGVLGGLDHGDEIENVPRPVDYLEGGDDDDRLRDKPAVFIALVQYRSVRIGRHVIRVFLIVRGECKWRGMDATIPVPC